MIAVSALIHNDQCRFYQIEMRCDPGEPAEAFVTRCLLSAMGRLPNFQGLVRPPLDGSSSASRETATRLLLLPAKSFQAATTPTALTSEWRLSVSKAEAEANQTMRR